jgi:hypothetical protein
MESSMSFLKKLKINLPYDPATALLGIYPKEYKLGYNRATCPPMFIVALFTIDKLWKQTRQFLIKEIVTWYRE